MFKCSDAHPKQGYKLGKKEELESIILIQLKWEICHSVRFHSPRGTFISIYLKPDKNSGLNDFTRQ